jgi:glycosyltransferase involved in cell wall biosynthesis
MPRVSIVLPAYNRAATVGRAIASVVAQTMAEWELIIVDDGSADDLEAAVAMFGDGRVRVLRHDRNRGAAAARNTGIRAARAPLVAFVDDDCVAAPQWLASALATLGRAAGPTVVAGAIGRWGARASWVSLFDSVSYLQQENYVRYSRACVTANVVMHRSTFERIGPFDESFREAACEDWEWSLRARERSVAIVFNGSAAVEHPCMERLDQLRRKAERLARGELQLRRKTDEGAAAPGLLAEVGRQLRRSRKVGDVGVGDRLRVCCVSLPVAYWMWRAGRDVGLAGGARDASVTPR